MDYRIELTTDSVEALNHLIDEKLKQGYLIKDAMFEDENGQMTQIMVQAHNIDGELTWGSIKKLAIFLPVYFTILYFIL